MVDGAMRIRRFNPSAQRMLNLITIDIGRPICDDKHTLERECALRASHCADCDWSCWSVPSRAGLARLKRAMRSAEPAGRPCPARCHRPADREGWPFFFFKQKTAYEI